MTTVQPPTARQAMAIVMELLQLLYLLMDSVDRILLWAPLVWGPHLAAVVAQAGSVEVLATTAAQLTVNQPLEIAIQARLSLLTDFAAPTRLLGQPVPAHPSVNAAALVGSVEALMSIARPLAAKQNLVYAMALKCPPMVSAVRILLFLRPARAQALEIAAAQVVSAGAPMITAQRPVVRQILGLAMPLVHPFRRMVCVGLLMEVLLVLALALEAVALNSVSAGTPLIIAVQTASRRLVHAFEYFELFDAYLSQLLEL
jgi:hypothetical protein